MAEEARSYGELYTIPPAARASWAALEDALEVVGPVPCEESALPEAWWSTTPSLTEQAVAGCMACPVLEECLAYAVAAGEAYGVWGGRTPAERGFRRRGRRDVATEGMAAGVHGG